MLINQAQHKTNLSTKCNVYLTLNHAFKVLIPSQSKLNSTLDSQTKLAQIYNYAYN